MKINEEEFEILMVKVIDDAASKKEREQLMTFLDEYPDRKREYEEHIGISSGFKNIRLRLTHDDKLDKLAQKPLRRFEEKLGTGLIVGGLGFVSSMAIFEFLVDNDVPAWLKTGIAIAFAGSLLLLFSAWRNRQAASASDPYQEVQR
ncbi:MAG: hypothetical protein GY822_05905 [Deltaproteobacteria bacterium]|nr:hypothetical protein [Deltaproteobacteria bacterium]